MSNNKHDSDDEGGVDWLTSGINRDAPAAST